MKNGVFLCNGYKSASNYAFFDTLLNIYNNKFVLLILPFFSNLQMKPSAHETAQKTEFFFANVSQQCNRHPLPAKKVQIFQKRSKPCQSQKRRCESYCESRKELAHTMVRLQLILFSKRIGAFQFRTFGGFLHVPTTQIYCLTGAIISEKRTKNILYI